MDLRRMLSRRAPTPKLTHEEKVERICGQLRQYKGSRPLSLRKRSTSHQVPKPNERRHNDDKIDLSDLDQVLSIDVESKTCTAEPGVTFVDLVHATLPHGLVPIIVPELKTITIGGAVSGCSIESMSFKHGGFHDTCLEYEVITANGDLLNCTPQNEHQLVFQMMHGSFGTLGVLSKLTFKLVPAKPWVHLIYPSYKDVDSYQDAIWSHFKTQDVDYMDGIIHSPDKYVLSLGRFTDEAPYTSSYNWVKAYYETTAERVEDFFTTPDYFFRYDRGVTNVRPNSKLGRLFLGPFVHSSNLLRFAEKIHWALPKKNPTVTVDVFIPFSRFGEFMEWYWREFGSYRLWCVPYRAVHRYEWLSEKWWSGMHDELFVDLAIYGYKQEAGRNMYRALEEQLQKVNGVKTLISYNYYSEEEFWSIWNRENYQQVKQLTDPRNLFRDLYTKTCRAAMGKD